METQICILTIYIKFTYIFGVRSKWKEVRKNGIFLYGKEKEGNLNQNASFDIHVSTLGVKLGWDLWILLCMPIIDKEEQVRQRKIIGTYFFLLILNTPA